MSSPHRHARTLETEEGRIPLSTPQCYTQNGVSRCHQHQLKTCCFVPSQFSSHSKSSTNRHHAQGCREVKQKHRTERRTGNRNLSCERRVWLLLKYCSGPDRTFRFPPPACCAPLTQELQNHKNPSPGFQRVQTVATPLKAKQNGCGLRA